MGPQKRRIGETIFPGKALPTSESRGEQRLRVVGLSYLAFQERGMINLDTAPVTQLGSHELYGDTRQMRSLLPRLELFHSGSAVEIGVIDEGEYGSCDLGDGVVGLGTSIDVLLLARRVLAKEFRGPDVYVASDPATSEFQRIAKRARKQDGYCLLGPSFLVFERTTRSFFNDSTVLSSVDVVRSLLTAVRGEPPAGVFLTAKI